MFSCKTLYVLFTFLLSMPGSASIPLSTAGGLVRTCRWIDTARGGTAFSIRCCKKGNSMSEFAIWRRLDTPGHDAAVLTRSDTGWSLRGTAVFKYQDGPACLNYSVDIDTSWKTKRGEVHGFLADRKFKHIILREPEGWYLNGDLIVGLEHLWDLDYGFTPATNLQQLRRVAVAPGQPTDIPVAWFDIDRTTLTELPQRYERRSETTYWYVAPTVSYEGLLELSQNGFASIYPRLWQMEI